MINIDKIRNRRISIGYSQEYLAQQLGISQRAYSKLERGEIKIDDDKFCKIIEVFNLTSDEIIEFNPDDKTQVYCNEIKMLKRKIKKLQSTIDERDSLILKIVNNNH